jgi:hypothetical protein
MRIADKMDRSQPLAATCGTVRKRQVTRRLSRRRVNASAREERVRPPRRLREEK